MVGWLPGCGCGSVVVAVVAVCVCGGGGLPPHTCSPRYEPCAPSLPPTLNPCLTHYIFPSPLFSPPQVSGGAHLVRALHSHGLLDARPARPDEGRGEWQVRLVPEITRHGRRRRHPHQTQVRESRRAAVQGGPEGQGRGQAGTHRTPPGSGAQEGRGGVQRRRRRTAGCGGGRGRGRGRSQRHGAAHRRDRCPVRGPADQAARRGQGPHGGQVRGRWGHGGGRRRGHGTDGWHRIRQHVRSQLGGVRRRRGGEEQRRTWEPPLPRPSPRDLAWPWVLWGPRPGLRDRWWREPVRSLPRVWPPRRQGPAAGWREDISRDWEDRWHRRRGGSGAASGAAWQRLPRP